MDTSYATADRAWVCTRKKAYPTEQIAKQVIRGMVLRNPVRPYACLHCGSWHIGADPRRNAGA